MIAVFESYLRTEVGLSEEDINQVCSSAVQKSLRRNELLLQEGQVSRYKVFILKGLLHTYSTTADGSEHILQFSPAYNWTLDVESYDREIPALTNIIATEPSEVLLWNKADFERLRIAVPKLQLFAQQIISRNIYNSRQRIITMLSATPEEKYEDFMRAYPDLMARLPLRMIASYLGISIKTLTRIRHAQAHR